MKRYMLQILRADGYWHTDSAFCTLESARHYAAIISDLFKVRIWDRQLESVVGG